MTISSRRDRWSGTASPPLASGGGYLVALSNLALSYDKGWGVPRNPVTAYIWYSIAARWQDPDRRGKAAIERDRLAKEISLGQLADVQRAAQNWKPGMRGYLGVQVVDLTPDEGRGHCHGDKVRSDGRAGYGRGMATLPFPYRRHRFPPGIIQHAIWLYLRFTLSYRDVQELLAERGLDVSYETVRRWVLKFGPIVACRLRQRRPRPSDRWHLDEMVVRIAGRRMYLWRAVDHEGEILNMLVQRHRDKRAALRLMRKLLKKQGLAPKLLVTDKLGSYRAAFRQLRLACPHEQGLRKNNRVENSHQSRAPARAQNATVQVGRVCAALPQHPCRRPQHVQFSTRPHLPIDAADLPSGSEGGLGGGRRHCMIRMAPRPL
jgi:putative transposase